MSNLSKRLTVVVTQPFGTKKSTKLRNVDKRRHHRRRRKRPGFVFEFFFGLVLNILGCALGIWRAEMDHGAIQAEVDQRLLSHGLINVTRTGGTEIELHEPSSILMTFGTMAGRMFNVVGTVKMYKSVAKFVARRRRDQLRQTAEKLGGAEADADWSEALVECCQFFV